MLPHGDSEQSRAEGWVSPPRGQQAEACGRLGVSTTGTVSRAMRKAGGLHHGVSRQSRTEGWVCPPWGQQAEPCGRVGVFTTGSVSRAVWKAGSLHHGVSRQSRTEGWVSPQRLCYASLCQVCARLLPHGQRCT